MFTFGIVDDEYEYLHIISDCIVDCIGNNHDIYRFKSGKDLIKSNLTFDLVFLDIELETEDGIEVAKKLDYITSGIIFITSHQEKVFDAFNKNVYKFVLKNNLKKFFNQDFLEILYKMNYDTVEIYHNKEIDKVKFDNIILVEYKNRNTEIVTVTNIFKLSKTPLKNFSDKLNNDLERKVDDKGNLFLRLSKEDAVDEKITIVDSGDSIHLKVKIAAYPAKKEIAIKKVREAIENN